MSNLRIHPAIGVARVGNSDQFFIGPESPGVPGNWDSGTSTFKPFKDSQGKIITSGLPTIHELGYQFRTNFSTIHPIREDQEEKRAQL